MSIESETAAAKNEREFLLYTVDSLYECCGPANDDIMADIVKEWKDAGSEVPSAFRRWDYSLSEDEREGGSE
jgi:hypothetical protein